MPKPDRHFTDLPAALDVHVHDSVMRVEGAGFVTRALTDNAFAPLASGEGLLPRIIVDLRNVSGYEAECVDVARHWLARATEFGVERIAFIANSSVVRTATDVVARHLHAPLRTFATADAAHAWIDGARDSVPPLATSGVANATRPRA